MLAALEDVPDEIVCEEAVLGLPSKSVFLSFADAGDATDLQEFPDSSAEAVRALGVLDGAGVVGEGGNGVAGEGVCNRVGGALLVADVEVEL